MDLGMLLADSARRTPSKTAVVADGRRTSYAELEAHAGDVARALKARGVGAGDRVVVCLENGLPHVAALFGVWKAGAAAVLVSAATKPDKLAHIVDETGAALVLSAGTLGLLRADGPAASGDGDGGDAGDADGERDAALIYTSGSSGSPKGVVHSHGSLLSATRSIVEYLENRDSDVVLQVLPLSFGYGLTQLLTMIMVGGTLALERGFGFPQVVLRRIAEEKATGLAVVPTIATLLLEAGMRRDGPHDLTSLRYVTNAGAGMAPALSARLRAALPETQLYLMYGQTECIRASYLRPSEVDRRPTSVGTGMPDTDLWLVNEAGERVEHGVGELVVRGPQVMRGYWKRDEDTKRSVRPGRSPSERVLFTGDIFRRDEDGFLHFVARRDDIIKTRGEKVSPKEVEDALQAVDGVAEAAVVGVPDALLGEAVVAFVVKRDGAPSGLDARAIRRACAERLEEWAVPKRVELVAALPRTGNGKIDKRALVRPHEARAHEQAPCGAEG